jgi:type II secretory pathway pseudopilin PulG
MQHSVKLPISTSAKRPNSSRGYILITLMLFMALVTMAALAVLPEIVQQIQRDREEEMLHRGTEYMRAIKKYYKKFGRYPTRIEELENTNQQRFLRKRYKDPLATKDDKEFKLIHVGDPSLNMLGMGGVGGGPGLAPGAGPGVTPRPGQAFTQTSNQNFVAAPGGGVRQAGPDDADTPQVTGLPGQQSSGTPNPAGADAGDSETTVDAKTAAASSDSDAAPGGQVFGGGPILGVASTSKAKTIREFNKKNHYNDWLFIYDPRGDRGGLLKGPIQPGATGGAGINQNGTPPPTPGQPGGTAPPASPPGQQEPPDEQ